MEESAWACYRVEISMLRNDNRGVDVFADFLVREVNSHRVNERLYLIDIVAEEDTDSSMLLSVMGRELYPIEIYVSERGEIVNVRNWRESLSRVKRSLKSYKDQGGERLYGYLLNSIKEIDSEEEYIAMLMRNTFFQLMFYNYVGGDRVHLVYDYPNYGDNVPFVYEKSPSVVNESGELYKAKLGRISAYNRYSYEGVARIKFQFSEGGLPNTVKASFLFDSDESGFYKKEVKIYKI